MNQQNATDYRFRFKNMRETALMLRFEPWGFGWELAPSDEYEAVFHDAKNFWSVESIDQCEDGVTFWGVYPDAVFWLSPDGPQEMMRGD